MFDRVSIRVKSGGGGDGATSFRREKFVPYGGPDGGDGGHGGNVVIKINRDVDDLIAYRGGKIYKAENGISGRGRKRHGRSGKDLVLLVPPGTTVFSMDKTAGYGEEYDLVQPGQQVVVAVGGRGGLGNSHFASATNQVPLLAQKGELGEEKGVLLELKLIADVGIVGYPNAGKSSLLAAASAAKPKIASYPFTTLEPILGVVEVGQDSFVVAEIPGLVVGAHKGRGLGHEFLRHVVRTRVLIHLLDGSLPAPVEDMIRINSELGLFDTALALKSQLVVINKVDLPEVRARMGGLDKAFSDTGIAVHFVSAVTGQGIPGLMAAVWVLLGRAGGGTVTAGTPLKEFHPEPVEGRVRVSRQGDTLVIASPEMERVVAGTDLTNPEARRQLIGYLTRPGLRRELERAGVKPGDNIRCGDFRWQW
ncbi:MAG: GTPase ObgE [Dehalococcoidales bacterium]|nr:GTPase ObgE [Dehalococcoidales bacterium]